MYEFLQGYNTVYVFTDLHTFDLTLDDGLLLSGVKDTNKVSDFIGMIKKCLSVQTDMDHQQIEHGDINLYF